MPSSEFMVQVRLKQRKFRIAPWFAIYYTTSWCWRMETWDFGPLPSLQSDPLVNCIADQGSSFLFPHLFSYICPCFFHFLSILSYSYSHHLYACKIPVIQFQNYAEIHAGMNLEQFGIDMIIINMGAQSYVLPCADYLFTLAQCHKCWCGGITGAIGLMLAVALAQGCQLKATPCCWCKSSSGQETGRREELSEPLGHI